MIKEISELISVLNKQISEIEGNREEVIKALKTLKRIAIILRDSMKQHGKDKAV